MRFIKYFILFVVLFLGADFNCLAVENNYVRSRDNLQVPDDVLIDGSNLESILKTPAVSSKAKIYDYASLIGVEDEAKLYKKINQFIKDSNIDCAIVTTRDLNGFTLEEFTYNFYDYNHFLNDGIIFVIYMHEDEAIIYMGNSGDRDGQVFEIYTNQRINQTLAYVYKDISVGKYVKAIDDYLEIVDGFYKINTSGNYEVNDSGRVVKHIPWIEISVLSIAMTFICMFLFVRKVNSIKNWDKVLANNLNFKTLIIKTDRDERIG